MTHQPTGDFCAKGHPRTLTGMSDGSRCRECRRARGRRYRERRAKERQERLYCTLYFTPGYGA